MTDQSWEAEVEFLGAAEFTAEKRQRWGMPALKHAKQKLREEKWAHEGTRHAEQPPPAFPGW